jgi:hypothetical protein
MNVNTKAALIIAMLICFLAVGLVGCHKCYKCAGLVAGIKCTKGIDTVYRVGSGGRMIRDTVNYYLTQGYSCDTIQQYYNNQMYAYTVPICDETTRINVVNDGDKCTLK